MRISDWSSDVCSSDLHQATVALVQRCERNGLVAKRRIRSDARYVEIRPTPRARALVRRVARSPAEALEGMDEVFRAASAAGEAGGARPTLTDGERARGTAGRCSSGSFRAETPTPCTA